MRTKSRSIGAAIGMGVAALLVLAGPIGLLCFGAMVAYEGCFFDCTPTAPRDWPTVIAYVSLAGLLLVDIGLWAWAGHRRLRPRPLVIAAVPLALVLIGFLVGKFAGAY